MRIFKKPDIGPLKRASLTRLIVILLLSIILAHSLPCRSFGGNFAISVGYCCAFITTSVTEAPWILVYLSPPVVLKLFPFP